MSRARRPHGILPRLRPRPRPRSVIDEVEEVAATAARLGVLLAAGLPPASAWRHLAEIHPRWAAASAADDPAEVLLHGADPLHPAGAARAGLAAAWLVASASGAPLAVVLQSFAGTLRELAETHRELHAALAGPRATAAFVLALPVIGVGFGFALGFDPVGALLGSVAGGASLILGLVLVATARWWTARLLRNAEPVDTAPGLDLELLAVALSGGASIGRARDTVDEVLHRCGLSSSPAAESILALSQAAGVPATGLLRIEAGIRRSGARLAARERAARLGVTLMLPLGLCVLPAFLLLAVVPLLLSVLDATVLAI